MPIIDITRTSVITIHREQSAGDLVTLFADELGGLAGVIEAESPSY